MQLLNREELGEWERELYQFTVLLENLSERRILRAALADLGDRDNNHVLCLATEDMAISIRFLAGYLVIRIWI